MRGWSAIAAVLVATFAFGATAETGRSCSLEAGRSRHEVEVVLGYKRNYEVVVGPKADSLEAAPLVFAWHAFGQNPKLFARTIDIARDWPEAVVVAAQGLRRTLPHSPRRERGWQVALGEYDNRDLAFFDALLADVSQRYCIDPRRVMSTGYSNGGSFTNLLGCLRGDVLAAIAPVAGSGPLLDTTCQQPLPALVQHDERDKLIPFQVGVTSFAHWAHNNACESPPKGLPRGCADAMGCKVQTRFCVTSYGRHVWPGGTTRRIVEFFRQQRRAEAPARAPELDPLAPQNGTRDEADALGVR
ncbi:MAG: hypothetical protein AAF430_05135 [Myxococcota bacterium]